MKGFLIQCFHKFRNPDSVLDRNKTQHVLTEEMLYSIDAQLEASLNALSCHFVLQRDVSRTSVHVPTKLLQLLPHKTVPILYISFKK
jgi:hypothetical protein